MSKAKPTGPATRAPPGLIEQALLYNVVCSNEEARRRVAARNQRADRSLYIAAATFELLKTRVEPLQADEAMSPHTEKH